MVQGFAGPRRSCCRGHSFLAGSLSCTGGRNLCPRNEYPGRDGFSEFNNHGISLTPLLFRWNVMKHEISRFVPWVQLGSGLLWTSEPFPFGNGPGAYTSRINFTPQVDLGESIFTKKNQSLNLAVKVIHISSAGLGEYNPGIPMSLKFSVGYSWWK